MSGTVLGTPISMAQLVVQLTPLLPRGPAGTAGAAGATGPTGATGAQGPAGTLGAGDASANLVKPWDAAGRTFAARAKDVANVLDFVTAGIDPTGTSDSTAAIQAALGQARAVEMPSGTYSVSSLTLTTPNQLLFGHGRKTRLIGNAAGGDIVAIGPNTGLIAGVELRDFVIWSAVAKTAGTAAIRLQQGQDCLLSNVHCGTYEDYGANGQRLAYGIVVAGFLGDWITGCSVIGCTQDGMLIYGIAGETQGAEIYITTGCQAAYNGGAGIRFAGGAGGCYVRQANIEENGQGIIIDVSKNTSQNREVFLDHAICDTNTQQALLVAANSLDGLLHITASWFADTTTAAVPGLEIEASSADIIINGCYIYANQGIGALFNGGNITAANVQAIGNGASTSGGDGLKLSGGANAVHLLNVVCTNNGTGGSSGYGIRFDTTAPLYTSIIGGNLGGNASGAISPAPPNDQDHLIRDLVSYVDANSGDVAVGSGVSFVTVAHGLNDQPAVVRAWPTSAPQAPGIPYIDGTSINATSFTYHFGGTLTAAVTVGWEAHRSVRP